MKQKYVYIPNKDFWAFGKFLNLLENDRCVRTIYFRINKEAVEKTKCLKMLKNLFEDQVLKEEDYHYLMDKAWEFYMIIFPIVFFPLTEREAIRYAYGN